MKYLLMATKSDAGFTKVKFDTVAGFTSKEKADAYLAKSKLKKPIKRFYVPDVKYKKQSLLRDYYMAYIEEYKERKDFVIDPKI